MRVTMLAAIGASLSACASNNGVLTTAGACAAFGAPEYEVAGRTRRDQKWINGQIESGVGACQWPRPQPRPASFDAKPVKQAVSPLVPAGPALQPAAEEPLQPQPVKKRRFDRLRKTFGR